MLTIDGSFGEGGGQILRSSLALSMVTGRPFRIEKIRAARKKPGLMRQHLTAVEAAAVLSGAEVEGAAIGSMALSFRPQGVRPGEYAFAVGTAGSTTLVFQTLLPALLRAPAPSRLSFEGGTHNPQAPPFDFLARSFLPLVNRMGARVTATLERPGFFPAGGGLFRAGIEPAATLAALSLLERGEIRRRQATAMVARLPRHIAEREVRVVGRELGWEAACLRVEEVTASRGPGNVVMIEIESRQVTEVFTSFGELGVRAEAVAARAAKEAKRYLEAGVPVGEYLADQLLLPLAVAGAGSFITMPLSRHATTQIDLIGKFLDARVSVEELPGGDCLVRVGA
jgi:RNA 3'-terminal phosphate cyclase (ATP)